MEANREEQMFNGPILPLILKLALPIFAGMVFQLIYNITDTIWISRIDLSDPSIVGGVGIIFPLMFFIIALSNGLMVGTASLVARAVGEKSEDKLDAAADSGIFLAVIISILVLVLGYIFLNPLVSMLGAEGSYFANARDYLAYILPAAAFMFIANVFMGVLQGEGLMKYVMVSMILGTVLNVILDPIAIFVFNMGIKGAALATVISQAIAFLYIVFIFLSGRTRVPVHFKLSGFRAYVMKEITVVGFPQALGQMIMSLSFLIFNTVVISIDERALTAFALCGRIDQAVLMPIFAIASAIVTIVGQNYGRKRFDRVKKAWSTAITVSISVSAVVVFLIVIFAPKIYAFFTDVPEVLDYAVRQVRFLEYAFIFSSLGILGRSFFQAVGKGWNGMVLVLLRLILLAVPAVIIFVYVFDWGIYGVWGGVMLGNLLTALISAIWIPRSIKKMETAAA
ncbi:MATE family efflux transporter [Spirochaetia bacterium 38H-sp]|uniref:MATE family efflux transporter n=1 Tax=Rarispira pelagica TaxID=3141764 RepID=A0ABU9U917_9SPIR